MIAPNTNNNNQNNNNQNNIQISKPRQRVFQMAVEAFKNNRSQEAMDLMAESLFLAGEEIDDEIIYYRLWNYIKIINNGEFYNDME